MNPTIIYFIKSSILILLFYSFYRLFLQKETWYRFNRFYLLASIFLSLILPLLSIPSDIMPLPAVSFQLGEVSIYPNGKADLPREIQFSIENMIMWIYVAAVVAFLMRFLWCIYRLFVIRMKSEMIEESGETVYISPKIPSSFSFLIWVFLDENQNESTRRNLILKHELAHIRQFHSIDLIIAELFKAFFWFNPLAWLYPKALREVHEYLADREVLLEGTRPSEYMNALMQQIDLSNPLPISNHFNQSLLKRRFFMITKSKSGLWHIIRTGLMSPVLLIACALVINGSQNTTLAQDTKKSVSAKKSDTPKKDYYLAEPVVDDEKVFQVVEVMPVYSGGQDAMYKYIQQNVVYPQKAKEIGAQADIYISFVVDENGKMTKVKLLDAKSKPLDKGAKKVSKYEFQAAIDAMSNEAIRVISGLPEKWKPGTQEGKAVKVAFTLPVKFSLD